MTEPYRPNGLEFPFTSNQLDGLNLTIDDIYDWLRRLSAAVTALEGDTPVGPFDPIAHDLLGVKHSDTTPVTPPTEGDIIVAQSALWARKGVGTEGQVLGIVGGVPDYTNDASALSLPHDVLGTQHVDSEPAPPVLGDIIVADQVAALQIEVALDGSYFAPVIGDGDGGGAYWFDGAVYESVDEAATVLWKRKAIGAPGTVLTSDGTRAEWLSGNETVGARVYSAASFVLADATLTTVGFDTVDDDDDGFFDPLADTRLTVPEGRDGWYAILAGAIWPEAVTGFATWVAIKVNGTEVLRNWVGGGVNVPFGSTGPGQCALLKKLVEGDYVEMAVEVQNYGAVTITGGQGTFLSMVKL
jgi:hypothetical protein